ncbi:hypothetical protein VSK92_02900 [Bacillus swezeyi]
MSLDDLFDPSSASDCFLKLGTAIFQDKEFEETGTIVFIVMCGC